MGNTIITVTEAKKRGRQSRYCTECNPIADIQRNPKKRSYDTAGLHEDVMYQPL